MLHEYPTKNASHEDAGSQRETKVMRVNGSLVLVACVKHNNERCQRAAEQNMHD